MTKDMQTEFKALSKARHFWHRASTATHQDLAGVFVACAVERYLKTNGRLGFVVPNSVIDRDFWEGFRQGVFDGAGVKFDIPWDLRRIRPHMFPRGSAVIFGTRTRHYSTMPAKAVVWRGRAPKRHMAFEDAAGLNQNLEPLIIASADDDVSPYHYRFRTAVTPRHAGQQCLDHMLCTVIWDAHTDADRANVLAAMRRLCGLHLRR
jgi:hypothetical protein